MKSAEWYKSILDSMKDMVLVKGPNSSLLWANKPFLDFYGMTEKDLENIVDGPQSDPDDTLQYVQDDKKVFETQKDLDIPYEPVTSSNGEVKYFHTIKSPIFENGHMVKSVGVSRLIVDDKIFQQGSDQQDKKVFTAPLRSIIDTLPTKAMLLDQGMRIIKCNRKWVNKIGDYKENSSHTFDHFYQPFFPLVKMVSDSLEKNTDIDKDVEVLISKKEYVFNVRVSPWKYLDESIGGVIVIATDITESIQREHESVLQARRLNLALESSNIGIWEFDLESNSLVWDSAMYDLYGIEEKDFSGAYSAWEQGLHPDDKERSAKEIKDAVGGGDKFDTEFRVKWPCGNIRNIRAIADVIYKDNKPVKMIGVNWDITKSKEYEYQLTKTNASLERANSELMQFSYRASHDLKAPLIAIRGLADFIIDDINEGSLDEAIRNLNVIKHQASTLEVLVADLFELARADVGVEKKISINFEDLIEKVKSLNLALMKENGVVMSHELEISHDWRFSHARLFQIINNLISNSVKYYDSAKENSYVKLRVKEADNYLMIEVEDNGTGIPYKNKEEVFEMFKRYHTKKIAGSGVGMYVLKKHVDALDGEIDFESSKEGTTFTIYFKRP